MKNLTKLMIQAIAVAGLAAVANGQTFYFARPVVVPPQLVPPANYYLGGYAAIGTQNYSCGWDTTSVSYKWTQLSPQAMLYDANGNLVGRHAWTASNQPYWASLVDGSWAIGQVAGKPVDSPNTPQQAIPSLLLSVQSSTNTGQIGRATYVQRLYTNGGIPPTETCDGSKSGVVRNVAYTAM